MTEPRMAEWTAAFVSAQADMPEIPKGKTATIQTRGGGSFSYAYADLPAIIAAVTPVLEKHGLAFAQSVVPLEGGIGVETRIYHRAGHVETFGPVALPAGEDARAVGSAITYGRRYSLCAALGIAADEDDDAASATRRNAPARPARPAPAREEPSGWIAEIEALRKALGWTPSRTLTFARKLPALDDVTSYDWTKLTEEQAEVLATYLRAEDERSRTAE